MAYKLPSDVPKTIPEQMSACGYSSEGDVLRDALPARIERHEFMLADDAVAAVKSLAGGWNATTSISEWIGHDRLSRRS